MKINFLCPHCKDEIAIDSEISGDRAECPSCHEIVLVPATGIDLGMEIGGFRIERRLGVGGMGEVFEATQLAMNRRVALKVLPPGVSSYPARLNRFIHEVEMAAKLEHPNIVTAFYAGSGKGYYYLAMSFVDGISLDKRLDEGVLKEKEALEICQKVSRALHYSWSKFNMLHRDIKPANIMIDREGEVKVMDMGIAKTINEDSGLTAHGALVGTPYYMSPEQALANIEIDCRADIYSLGASFYHMVTGIRPFDGPNAMAVIARHLSESPQAPRELNPRLSPGCSDLVLEMMARDRDQRPKDWIEVQKKLSDAIHRRSGTQPPMGAPSIILSDPIVIGTRNRAVSPTKSEAIGKGGGSKQLVRNLEETPNLATVKFKKPPEPGIASTEPVRFEFSSQPDKAFAAVTPPVPSHSQPAVATRDNANLAPQPNPPPEQPHPISSGSDSPFVGGFPMDAAIAAEAAQKPEVSDGNTRRPGALGKIPPGPHPMAKPPPGPRPPTRKPANWDREARPMTLRLSRKPIKDQDAEGGEEPPTSKTAAIKAAIEHSAPPKPAIARPAEAAPVKPAAAPTARPVEQQPPTARPAARPVEQQPPTARPAARPVEQRPPVAKPANVPKPLSGRPPNARDLKQEPLPQEKKSAVVKLTPKAKSAAPAGTPAPLPSASVRNVKVQALRKRSKRRPSNRDATLHIQLIVVAVILVGTMSLLAAYLFQNLLGRQDHQDAVTATTWKQHFSDEALQNNNAAPSHVHSQRLDHDRELSSLLKQARRIASDYPTDLELIRESYQRVLLSAAGHRREGKIREEMEEKLSNTGTATAAP